jgi:peptide chain release factor 2
LFAFQENELWQNCKKELNRQKAASKKCGGIFDLAHKQEQAKNLEKQMEDSHFWDNPDQASKVISERNLLLKWIIPYQEIKKDFDGIEELYPEAVDLGDNDLLQELEESLTNVEEKISKMEIQKMLSNELDGKSCYFSINAGAGGTESCDWAQMLSRMYQRYAQRKGWKIRVVDTVEGEVAGIKSITYEFEGDFAYGYCKSEKGVHRLVRISPFDSNARRHTSFASVEVTPIIEDAPIELKPDELRIDTFRASGAGGQHVNKTDSAVRMTHIPTGIAVSCQSERSQVQNRETCLSMLKAKLYEIQVWEKEQKLKEIAGEKKEIAWGSQIRNYVFQPYTMVKDMRTKVESGNIQAVMDGEIDSFIEAYLKEFG